MTEPKPIERVEAALAGIERDQTNAFITVLADDARARATALEQSDHRGPLYGIPVALKDFFDIDGVPTTGGCAAYASRVAAVDADLVKLLREAGAVIVGKTNVHELGFGATGVISAAGPARNPLDPEVLPGGSSSGSAVAVAAGYVPLAIGTDTGGSIRIPASFCGIVGLKPTPGSISLTGAMPVSPALDCAGPMAATVRECAAAWEVLSARPDPSAFPQVPPPSPPLVRIGLSPTFLRRVHTETRLAVEQAAGAFEAAGAEIVEVPEVQLVEGTEAFQFVWSDAALYHSGIKEDDQRLHPQVAAVLRFGRSRTGLDYARSMEDARRVRRSFRRALGQADVLLAPSTPYPAPPVKAKEVDVEGGTIDVHRGGPATFTAPVNVSGLPALAFPIGRSTAGLPLGAQLIGRPWSERLLLDLGLAYERGRKPATW